MGQVRRSGAGGALVSLLLPPPRCFSRLLWLSLSNVTSITNIHSALSKMITSLKQRAAVGRSMCFKTPFLVLSEATCFALTVKSCSEIKVGWCNHIQYTLYCLPGSLSAVMFHSPALF